MPLKFRLAGLAETFVDNVRCPKCGHDGGDGGDEGCGCRTDRSSRGALALVVLLLARRRGARRS